MLPPLKVQFSDSFGNPAAMPATATPLSLSISVAQAASPGSELQPCEELQVVAQQGAVEDGLLITGLQLLGSEAAAAANVGSDEPSGMQLLAGGDALSHPTARQAQALLSKQCLPTAEVQLCISLQSSPDLAPVVVPLRVRAGAPQSLRLLPGSPWEAAPDSVVTLQHGGRLEAFQVAAYDAWGNPTAPSADLGFAVLGECGATAPQAKEFAVGPLGTATLEGVAGYGPVGRRSGREADC